MAASFKADDRRASQWYIDYMKAPAAWEILEANVPSLTPAKVAIIDTGASLDHLDLSNVVNREQSIEVIHGEDSDLSSWKWQPLRGDGYVNGSAGVEEFSSHGTHVSGIVAAEAGNGGILGVASSGVTTLNRLELWRRTSGWAAIMWTPRGNGIKHDDCW